MHQTPWKLALGTALSAGLIAAPLTAVPAAAEVSAAAGTSPVVINEAYLSGGSSGAAFKNKFVELYNTSDAPVALDGWSVQYRSATGTAAPSGVAALSGSIPAKGYYLVQGSSNGANGADLPSPDLVAGALNFAGGAGTIVLAKQPTAVALPTGSVVESPGVADLLGYGTSNTFETQAAAAPAGNTDVKSLNRAAGTDSNSNTADFTLSAAITPTSSGGTAPTPDPTPVPTPDPVAKAIAEIQGTGTESPLTGATVTTRGKVTAAFPTGGLSGYYIQTPGTGGELTSTNHAASDGIFVYSPATAGSVQTGDYVQVTGTVAEYYGMTQLNVTAASGLAKLAEAAPEVKPTLFTLPATETFRESLEGMLLAPRGPLTVSDNF
ncbi:MAG TPA: lamin tail domain-containing protein, partial [Arthrobacter sp.]|nr:lamin tail domain-containing protein [Arthrobacter sp.]